MNRKYLYSFQPHCFGDKDTRIRDELNWRETCIDNDIRCRSTVEGHASRLGCHLLTGQIRNSTLSNTGDLNNPGFITSNSTSQLSCRFNLLRQIKTSTGNRERNHNTGYYSSPKIACIAKLPANYEILMN